MNRRQRIGHRQLEDISSRLSPTDWKILEFFGEFRLASTRHLQLLFYGPKESDNRRCRRRINQLIEHGLLQRLPRRVGGRGPGSDATVLRLGRAGGRLIDTSSTAGPRWQPSAEFATHTLGIVDLLVELTTRTATGDRELLAFVPEPTAWRDFTWGMRTLTLKPDAFTVICADGVERHYFIELDLGTESMTVIANKIGRYLNYYNSRPNLAVFPQVLFLVDAEASYHTRGTSERVEQIRQTAREVLAEEMAALVAAHPRDHPPWNTALTA